MFDTMTMTKAVGGVCGSLLVFLLLGFAGETVYQAGAGGEGHGGEAAQAYVIETGAGEAPAGGEEASGPPADLDALIAAADPAAGAKVFAKCKACHKVDGKDGTGPHLNGVVNRNKGSIAAFPGYSDGMKALSAETWTPADLYQFLETPKAYLPGTKMNFQGLPKLDDRVAIIAYLASVP
jgi:cytochrome c